MTRWRLEGGLAALFALAAIATAVWPTWIEELTGWEPDEGSGELEVWIVVALAVVAVVAALLARRDYRAASRTRPA